MSYHKGINWDLEPLGKVSDCQLSKKLGVNSGTVRKARLSRNIKPFRSMPEYFNKINWDEQPLGQINDSELARKLKVSQTLVSVQRRKRNIEIFSEDRLKINWNILPLGEKSDREIAEELNVSSSFVAKIRVKMGIKSWEETKIPQMNNDEGWCFSCQIIKNKNDFTSNEFRRSGKAGQCRKCVQNKKMEKYKNNEQYRIVCKLRGRLKAAFNSYSKKGKTKTSQEYGISWNKVCEHLYNLEYKEDDEIDHIVPLSFFNLDDENQIKLAFSEKNHCWIDKNDNHVKSDKLLYVGGSARNLKNLHFDEKLIIYNKIIELFWKNYK